MFWCFVLFCLCGCQSLGLQSSCMLSQSSHIHVRCLSTLPMLWESIKDLEQFRFKREIGKKTTTKAVRNPLNPISSLSLPYPSLTQQLQQMFIDSLLGAGDFLGRGAFAKPSAEAISQHTELLGKHRYASCCPSTGVSLTWEASVLLLRALYRFSSKIIYLHHVPNTPTGLCFNGLSSLTLARF